MDWTRFVTPETRFETLLKAVWVPNLLSVEVAALSSQLWSQRWSTGNPIATPSILPYVADGGMEWHSYLEMFFLMPTRGSENVLVAQNLLKAAIVRAYEQHRDELNFDDPWVQDVMSLRWGRRDKFDLPPGEGVKVEVEITNASKEVLLAMLADFQQFGVCKSEYHYQLLNNLVLNAARSLGIETWYEMPYLTDEERLTSPFRDNDYHLMRGKAFPGAVDASSFEATEVCDEEWFRSPALEELHKLFDCLLERMPMLRAAMSIGDNRKADILQSRNTNAECILDHSLAVIWQVLRNAGKRDLGRSFDSADQKISEIAIDRVIEEIGSEFFPARTMRKGGSIHNISISNTFSAIPGSLTSKRIEEISADLGISLLDLNFNADELNYCNLFEDQDPHNQKGLAS